MTSIYGNRPVHPSPDRPGSLTVREWFVGQALTGLLAHHGAEELSVSSLAGEAVRFADATLAELYPPPAPAAAVGLRHYVEATRQDDRGWRGQVWHWAVDEYDCDSRIADYLSRDYYASEAEAIADAQAWCEANDVEAEPS